MDSRRRRRARRRGRLPQRTGGVAIGDFDTDDRSLVPAAFLAEAAELAKGHVRNGHLDTSGATSHASVVEQLELVPVRLHDPTGGDAGFIELPLGWVIELGDLLVDEDGRLVRVVDFVLTLPEAVVAALVQVEPMTVSSWHEGVVG